MPPDEPTVVVESGPTTQAATAAAVVANTAAQDAARTAAELSAQAQREAEQRTAEIASETGDAIRQQEDRLSWLREHATTQQARSEALATEVTALRQEQSQVKEAVTGLAGLLQSLASRLSTQTQSPSPEVTEPPNQNASVGGQSEAQTKRKRRLI